MRQRVRMASSTPEVSISNFFFMLVYAWSHYKPEQLKLFGREDYRKPIDFLCALLCQSVNENIVHNLATDHQRTTERLRTVRGRIELKKTLLSPDWKAGVVVCNHPVVAVDTLENQLIKATLRQVSLSTNLGKPEKAEAKRLFAKLSSVSDIGLTRLAFRRTNIDRSMRWYRFPLSLCELLFDESMVSESDGKNWFANYVRDEVAMRRLFEAFVAGLLRHKMRGRVQVGSRRFSPYGLDIGTGSGSLIPSMRTDVSVKSASKIVIIDTKYTKNILQEHYGNKTIRSEHFYQVQAYTEHSCAHFPKHEVSAIVLYPRAGTDLDLKFAANGRAYTFRTIDLSQDWKLIEEDIFSLVKHCV